MLILLFVYSALHVQVSPTYQAVGVGVAASFECLVTGNPIKGVSWNRDFESLQNGKVC